MKQLKKTLLTLVALLAVTTGAWATEFTSLKVGDVLHVGDAINTGTNYKVYGLYLDAGYQPATLVRANIGTNDITESETGAYYLIKGKNDFYFGIIWGDEGLGGYWPVTDTSDGISVTAITPGDYTELTFAVHEGTATPVDGFAWDKATKTGTFTMPGGNVTLEPEYYPQAALTAAPTAINDVPATTDGAIVKAGTVATIGSTETAQGTVMYYVSQTALDDAALLALAADQWTADVPTAESLTKGEAYVYYYVRGNDSDNDEENFSDGDILAANALTVTIAAEPTYAVTFAEGTDPNEWTADPAAGVKKGETVTVTYTGSKKVLGVKAEKKAKAPVEVLTYSFDDASHPSGLTAGSRVSFDYSRTSVITNSKFLNAYNNTNGDPNATTVSLGDTDLSGETWTLSFEWAACGGCNNKPDHTTLKAGDATLFDLSGNSNWNTTVTIIYTGSDGSKTLPVPGCDKSNRFTAAVGDQYNTTTYWHHIVVTGSAEGVKMTITNSSTGAAVVEDVVLSETNVNPTSLIIEPCCGGGIGIDALSLTYEE